MGVSRIIKKYKKTSLLFLYVGVCLIYGIVYWVMANYSNGELFMYQEDILLKSKVISFEKELGVEVDYGIAKAVFTSYNNEFYFGHTSGNYPILYYKIGENGAEVLGMDWLRYYYAQWSQQGYNFYKIEEVEDAYIYATKKIKVLKLTLCRIPEETYVKISSNQYITLPSSYDEYVVNSKEYYITLDDNFIDELDYSLFYPLYQNLYFISNTYNCLDKAPLVVYDYERNNRFIYPLPDFLYFSAVTISTLGYGDILPNSTVIRILVMTEVLFGMIMIAIIASAFYDYFKNVGFKKN